MMQIPMEEDLFLLEGAELYCELWGGHAGTKNKRVTVNGRTTYAIPETGTADGYQTHQYATIPLKLTDLVGLDVRLAIAEHLHKELGEQFRPPQILRRLVRAGKLGKKTGAGFYSYPDEKQ
jgi:hypothetical protein